MFRALDETGNVISAFRASRFGNFTCPDCNEKVIFKPCIEIHSHFAHKPESKCPFSRSSPSGESARHEQMKDQMQDMYKSVKILREPRNIIPNRRPDLLVTLNDNKSFVIECQASNTTQETLIAKTQDWNKFGYPVLWIWDKKLITQGINSVIITTKEVAYCHFVSFGKIYLLGENGEIDSCHFDYRPHSKIAATPIFKELEKVRHIVKSNKGLNLVDFDEGVYWTPKKYQKPIEQKAIKLPSPKDDELLRRAAQLFNARIVD